MTLPKYITNILDLPQLTKTERNVLQKVTETYVFRLNEYYLGLINWHDPDDPIRKLVIPNESELGEYGKWDASDEYSNYVAKGCQHKYTTTALLLVSEVCGAYCRYCFRKRLFRVDAKEASSEVSEGLQYIQSTPSISNVLLTGGDPLMLGTPKLRGILEPLREIDHVKIIRIGSKMPVFNPMRIYEDESLLQLFRDYSKSDRKIYVMAHINHLREWTKEARRAMDALQQTGVITVNQTPILRGINDQPKMLGQLLEELSWAGVTPYYFFVNRPVAGNQAFVLPLQQVYEIVEEAKSYTSGLGRRVKLVMSHATGKLEILAITDGKIFLKYHQARSFADHGKILCLPCPRDAAWFDDVHD